MTLDKERTLAVNYSDLKLYHIRQASPAVLKIIHKGISVYFKPILKNNSNKLVVFFNGAYDPSKNTPPIFSRSSWYKDFDAHCLYVDDPTLHHTNVTVGWGVGKPSHHYLLTMSEIIIKISKFLKVYPRETVYFGSSAGGFLSLMMSIMHKNSVAVINNPQIHVREYSQTSRFNNLMEANFQGLSKDKVMSLYSERFNAMEYMNKHKHIPKIVYLLNKDSKKDVSDQFRPFLEFLDSKSQADKEKVEFLIYSAENGHNGVYPREKTAALINSILNKNIIL